MTSFRGSLSERASASVPHASAGSPAPAAGHLAANVQGRERTLMLHGRVEPVAHDADPWGPAHVAVVRGLLLLDGPLVGERVEVHPREVRKRVLLEVLLLLRVCASDLLDMVAHMLVMAVEGGRHEPVVIRPLPVIEWVPVVLRHGGCHRAVPVAVPRAPCAASRDTPGAVPAACAAHGHGAQAPRRALLRLPPVVPRGGESGLPLRAA
mmetsp:Transcript_64501/g.189131  ORF Transcript_64501/g.189131 Transcript_64501/m.189131 type:complete len:209 (+) Transcript_64501:3-629(+)